MSIFHRLTPEEVLATLKSVHELDKFGGYISSQMVRLRHDTGILVVDDMDAETMCEVLRKYDFKNVTPRTLRPPDDEVAKYPIVITDVCGIGGDLNSNGLQFADHVKRIYPLKQVVVMSGQMKSQEYKSDAAIISRLDGVFKKGASCDELAKLLDPCVRKVNDPTYVWRKIREELLSFHGEKKDSQITKVVLWEDQFVRQFLEVGCVKGGEAVREDWISAMTKIVGLATQVVELLSGIKELCPAVA